MLASSTYAAGLYQQIAAQRSERTPTTIVCGANYPNRTRPGAVPEELYLYLILLPELRLPRPSLAGQCAARGRRGEPRISCCYATPSNAPVRTSPLRT
jgi:hypothetical protein